MCSATSRLTHAHAQRRSLPVAENYEVPINLNTRRFGAGAHSLALGQIVTVASALMRIRLVVVSVCVCAGATPRRWLWRPRGPYIRPLNNDCTWAHALALEQRKCLRRKSSGTHALGAGVGELLRRLEHVMNIPGREGARLDGICWGDATRSADCTLNRRGAATAAAARARRCSDAGRQHTTKPAAAAAGDGIRHLACGRERKSGAHVADAREVN